MPLRGTGAARRFLSLAEGARSLDEAIERVAAGLLEHTSCPPTDLHRLYPLLNVTSVEEVEGLNVAGQLQFRDVGMAIVHAAGMPKSRVRFTIAHEMGHALLERTGRGRPRRGKELERICDRFAAELLMPRAQFVQSIDREPSLANLRATATRFETSLQTAAVRYAELMPCSVFFFSDGMLQWNTGAVDPRDRVVWNALMRAQRGETESFYARTRAWSGPWTIETRKTKEGQLFLIKTAKLARQ